MKKVLILLLLLIISAAVWWQYQQQSAEQEIDLGEAIEDIEEVIDDIVEDESFSQSAKSKAEPEKTQKPIKPKLKTSIESMYSQAFEPQIAYIESRSNLFELAKRSEYQIELDALQFNPYFGLEAEFANLNVAHKGQEGVLDKASEVNYRKGTESAALLLNIKGILPLTNKSAIFAKVGLNSWQIEESQLNGGQVAANRGYGPANFGVNSNQGTDVFYGVGYQYTYEQYVFSSEVKVFEIEGETYEIYTIGGGFRF
ncbi:hypothetical protein [Thalassotalea sp. Y01]|uniref:hypothetical protein n=1 Tax=Thalassotalea sp. Y01 TaxID=2729613 RepID=UPI00145F7C51|nr:hypothetical protein [Thalassotalea sp. Y01]NMP16284.1 hypothetical protein [Thalassotalea sp. Y01]